MSEKKNRAVVFAYHNVGVRPKGVDQRSKGRLLAAYARNKGVFHEQ